MDTTAGLDFGGWLPIFDQEWNSQKNYDKNFDKLEITYADFVGLCEVMEMP